MIDNTISINQNETVQSDALEKTASAPGEDRQDIDGKRGSLEVQGGEEPSGETTILPDGDRVSLTVYGQQVEVTKEEARAAAQKGIAFEQMKAQLVSAKNNPRLKALETIAEIKGQTVDEFIAAIGTEAIRHRVESEYGSCNEAPLEVLKDLIDKHDMLSKSLSQSADNDREAAWRNQLREFLSDNPGCSEIPKEVIEDARRTGSLMFSYTKHLADNLKSQLDKANRELEALKGRAAAADKATPKVENARTAEQSRDESFRNFMKSLW